MLMTLLDPPGIAFLLFAGSGMTDRDVHFIRTIGKRFSDIPFSSLRSLPYQSCTSARTWSCRRRRAADRRLCGLRIRRCPPEFSCFFVEEKIDERPGGSWAGRFGAD